METVEPLKSVLIVDDDLAFSRSLVRFLPTIGFRAAALAASEEDALERLRTMTPDVVMVDMNLGSSADGSTVAQSILAAHSVPVVYMSGALDERLVSNVLNGRGHGCIAKPFRPDVARATLLLAIDRHTREASVTQQIRDLRQASLHDELTGLHNRRGFLERAAQLANVARRTGNTVTLFSIDLDGLKHINDTLGHAAGDRVIADAGGLLMGTFRSTDVLARLGGDEFVVLGIDAEPLGVIKRIEEAISRYNASTPAAGLAMSIGFAVAAPGEDIATLMERGDVAMYSDKRRRRERSAHQNVRRDPPDLTLAADATRSGESSTRRVGVR